MTGVYDWVVSDPRKNKTLKGSAVFEYQVRQQADGKLVVIGENGKVLERITP
ncbi:hypothetical protein MUU53_16545 [Rhizobium lemnae]|uniref:Lipoprotein n=1 Tax=Rhizobium lemnae TaxID=1214924 RepID=A0ABV8E710_9HYPH|nr:hypothetical protein [Rhizobium lemnae]MCJ8509517.1 hypothetical protein [Rhizobium lemnae]